LHRSHFTFLSAIVPHSPAGNNWNPTTMCSNSANIPNTHIPKQSSHRDKGRTSESMPVISFHRLIVSKPLSSELVVAISGPLPTMTLTSTEFRRCTDADRLSSILSRPVLPVYDMETAHPPRMIGSVRRIQSLQASGLGDSAACIAPNNSKSVQQEAAPPKLCTLALHSPNSNRALRSSSS
jgi:hypothetical protein